MGDRKGMVERERERRRKRRRVRWGRRGGKRKGKKIDGKGIEDRRV